MTRKPTKTPSRTAAPPYVWSPAAIIGTVCGLGSSIGYTAANVYLRAVINCDPIFVSCMKAVPTLALALPWTLWMIVQGKRILPPSRQLTMELVAAAVLGQLAGNVAFQWALGVIGMAMCVPICLGAMILSSALMGRRVLNEHVAGRDFFSMAVLVLSVAVLSTGAPEAHRSVSAAWEGADPVPWWYLAAGIGATIVSGVAYAVLGVVIRRCASAGAPASTTLLTVAAVGFFSLGSVALLKLGPERLLATSSADFSSMLLAGVWNAVAFVALTQALKLTPVMYVNALNATQTGLAGIAGVVLFGEAATLALAGGMALTLLGLMLMGPPKLSGLPISQATESG